MNSKQVDNSGQPEVFGALADQMTTHLSSSRLSCSALDSYDRDLRRLTRDPLFEKVSSQYRIISHQGRIRVEKKYKRLFWKQVRSSVTTFGITPNGSWGNSCSFQDAQCALISNLERELAWIYDPVHNSKPVF